MKKSYLTRELANAFPLWSKVRTHEQSVGHLVLNAIAIPLEKMERELDRILKNQYLTTANLDEMDWVHRVNLSVDFEFDYDEDFDPLNPQPISPTVSGILDGTSYEVLATDENNLESFWYTSIPTRCSLEETVSGDHNLLTILASGFPQEDLPEHHLSGGTLWIEASGGSQYLTFADNELNKARILIHGYTRKGLEEQEGMIFPWDMKQKTRKEWREITKIEATNFEDDVLLTFKSGDFGSNNYLSLDNLRYSQYRNKIDSFWGLSTVSGFNTLDRIEYVSDEWQQLVMGSSQKNVLESWELLDTDGSFITDSVDMTLQPFTNNGWVLTENGTVHCYNLDEETVSGVFSLRDKTQSADVQIELDSEHVVRSEIITFMPIHARPLKEIRKYRVWYQTPSGTKFGISGGSPVAFTSDFWVIGEETISRTVENSTEIQATEVGEYLLVVEVIFVDDEEQTDKVICSVNYKESLFSFDLTTIDGCPSNGYTGIDFDSDQNLWVTTSGQYYQIGLQTDVMLLDYANKILYFKEEYDSVEVFTDD